MENTAQPLANSVESAARSVASLATAQSQLKQGEKAAAETKETLSLLEHNVKSLMLQNAGQEAHNAYQELLNGFTKKYGDSEHALGIRKGLADILLASSQRDYNNALTSCQNVQEMLLKNQLKMSDEDVANYSYLLSLMTENVKKQGQVYDSQKVSNYASAAHENALAVTENALRPYRKTIERANAYIAQATSPSQIKEAENKAKREEGFVNLLKQQEIQAALQNKDMAAYNALWRIIHGRDKAGDVKMVYNALQNYVEFESK